jgi:predicted DsbA family dithiol-disulfide isomerase
MIINSKRVWVVTIGALCCILLVVRARGSSQPPFTEPGPIYFGDHHRPAPDVLKAFEGESPMLKRINIEMVYDFACPWCYVGKRRLNEAIEQRPDLDVVVNWKPFQLNPDMPRAGRNRREYYRSKFGEAGAKRVWQSLRAVGEQERISFCDTPEAMAPNTLSAHVLMFWAAQEDAIDAEALGEKLYYAHHVACENIGDHEVLARIAGEVGMDEIRVMSKLATGEDEAKVQAHIQQAVARGVSSVPSFVMNDQYDVSGAQSAESLVRLFDQIANSEE